MGRLVLVVFMMIISGIIFLFKKGASAITGKEVTFKDESAKVMNSTAKGLNWMNDQWEKAKLNAGMSNDIFTTMSAFEIITKVKSNPAQFDPKKAESIYIDQAGVKMKNRQFDDARKLAEQLPNSEIKDFMLKEIEQKRSN